MLALADPAVAELYDKQAADGSDKKYPTTNYVRLELVYFEHRPGTMLDYACGLGANLIHMLECGHTVYGLDTSPHSIRRLQEKVDRTPELSARCHLSTVNKDASRLDLADVQFDYVICASLFSLLGVRERASALLAEFHRVMKPGGRIIVDVNGAESSFAVFAKPLGDDYFEYRGPNQNQPPFQTWCPDKKEKLAELVSEFFEVEEVGTTAHSFFKYVEQEFIVCARKSVD